VIRHELPDTGIVMLSSDTDGAMFVPALDSVSFGFASKTGSFDDLIDSIRQVATGDVAAPSTGTADQVMRGRRRGCSEYCRLTRREFEVLQLLADGRSTNHIVNELVLSVHTVRNHIRNILAKLGAQSRLEAVAIATRLGLVQVAGPEGDDDPPTEH
jgi:DNA-binding NarL/FixJ family response regulator